MNLIQNTDPFRAQIKGNKKDFTSTLEIEFIEKPIGQNKCVENLRKLQVLSKSRLNKWMRKPVILAKAGLTGRVR